MTRLVLIRHGESQVYVDGLVGGLATCNGLSDLGRRQAAALRDRLAATGELDAVDALIASTLPRARETAQIISPALGDLPVLEDEGLCELHPGEADGLTYDDFLATYGFDATWSRTPISRSRPVVRAWRCSTTASERRCVGSRPSTTSKTVVIACHGGVVDVALRSLFEPPHGGGVRAAAPRTPRSPSSSSCRRPKTRPVPRWRLVRYNDAAHLAGVT